MINVGETLLDYEPYNKVVTKINGYDIAGQSDSAEIDLLAQRVSQLENTSIVEDLPLGDSGLQVGDAYIDSSTGQVKVKLQ